MTNNLFSNEPTTEEIARYVAGIEASSNAITDAIASDTEPHEKRIAIVRNLQYIDAVLRNDAIKAEADLDAIELIRADAIEAIRPPEAPSVAAVNPIEAHLQRLGL
jgi:ABC-type iron transport system FetAB ATPase subunit